MRVSGNYSFIAIPLLGAVFIYNYWGTDVLTARKKAVLESSPIVESISESPVEASPGEFFSAKSPLDSEPLTVPSEANLEEERGRLKDSPNKLIKIKDREGRERSAQPRSLVQVKELLAQKRTLPPDTEFGQMEDINFTKDDLGMFSGVFVDGKNELILSLMGSPAGSLGAGSCVELPNGQKAQGGALKLREGGQGYAALMVMDQWYLRMGYAFAPSRRLVGELFRRNGDQWTSLGEIEAIEIKPAQLIGACAFRLEK